MRRVEIWTQPGVGTFSKRIADLPVAGGSVGRILSQATTMQVRIPKDYDRLSELTDPGNNDGALARVFEGSVNTESFYIDEVSVEDDEGGLLTISGPSIESCLDDLTIFPWDRLTEGPLLTKFPNWQYGEGNAVRQITDPTFSNNLQWPLENGGAEDGAVSPWAATTASEGFAAPASVETINNPSNARTGNYFFQIDPLRYHSGIRQRLSRVYPGKRNQFTAYIKEPGAQGLRFTFAAKVEDGFNAFHTNAFEFGGYSMAELDNVPSNGRGTPGGSSSGDWQPLNLDIEWGDSQDSTEIVAQFDHHRLTNGPVYWLDDVTIAGFGVGLPDWTPVGTEYMNDWFASDDYAAVDTHSMKMQSNGSQPLGGVGARIPVTFEEGAPYYARIQALTPDATNNPTVRISLLVRDGEALIATSTTDLLSDDTWETLEFETAIPQGILEGILHIAIDETTAETIYWDDVELRTGLAPQSPGYIVDDLLTWHQTNTGVLTWLTTSFSDVLGSNSSPWGDDKLVYTVVRGQTLRQVMEGFRTLGYEWEISWNGVSYDLNFYDKGNAGFDKTNDPAAQIIGGRDYERGTVRLRRPTKTRYLVEGLAGNLYEEADTAMEAGYGKRIGYIAQKASEAGNTLASTAEGALSDAEATKYGVKVEIHDDSPLAGIDLELGDIASSQANPELPKNPYRVQAYSVLGRRQELPILHLRLWLQGSRVALWRIDRQRYIIGGGLLAAEVRRAG